MIGGEKVKTSSKLALLTSIRERWPEAKIELTSYLYEQIWEITVLMPKVKDHCAQLSLELNKTDLLLEHIEETQKALLPFIETALHYGWGIEWHE